MLLSDYKYIYIYTVIFHFNSNSFACSRIPARACFLIICLTNLTFLKERFAYIKIIKVFNNFYLNRY